MEQKEDMTRLSLQEGQSRGIVVQIPQNCYDHMQGWCDAAETEVSGYGLVRLEEGVFKVSKVFLPEQHCSSGYTLIKSASLARLKSYLDHEKAKKLQDAILRGDTEGLDFDFPSFDLRFWWHTHYNFGVGWSGTDDNQAQEVARGNKEWSLSLVINQAHKSLCRADFVSPIGVVVDNLKVELVPTVGKYGKRDYKRDIERWVRPMPVYESKVKPTSAFLLNQSGDLEKYVYYKGQLMGINQYLCAKECPCGDGTCIDCIDTRKAMA